MAGLALGLPRTAQAQWSTDNTQNLLVDGGANDQVQPKVLVHVASGRVLVAYYDNALGGFDVRVQSYDAAGIAQWGSQGVLVCDRAVSSTQDYGFALDASGNAYLAYNNDGNVSGSAQMISAQKLDATGAKLWGANGVVASAGFTNVNSPRMIALESGDAVVGFSSFPTSSTAVVPMVRLSGSTGQILSTITANDQPRYFALSDLTATGASTFAAAFVRGSSSSATTSAKQLWAQKYESGTSIAAMGQLWSAGLPIVAFSVSSIQNGYFPTIVHDGSGGIVFGIYEIGSSRNSYLQHIVAAGTQRFGAPVATTGVTPGQIRTSASAAYDAALDEYYVASVQTNSTTQNTFSIIGQKFNSAGARQWTDTGLVIEPVSSVQPSFVQVQKRGSSAIYVLAQRSFGFGNGTIRGYGVDGAGSGSVGWTSDLSLLSGDKSRLTSAVHPSGFALAAFGSGQGGSVDAFIQNVRSDGTLGSPPAPTCLADLVGGDGNPPADSTIDGNDFQAFLNAFGSDNPLADIVGGDGNPPADGNVDGNDFQAFLNGFAAGC